LQDDTTDQMDRLIRENQRLERLLRVRRAFVDAAFRYFVAHDHGIEVCLPLDQVQYDGNPDWVPDLLARTTVHEPEFVVFQHFLKASETVLDIGANYGYSACSIWASGCKASILSFEPNPLHAPCLSAIKQLRSDRYDFAMQGVGERDDEPQFIVPVIEGIAVSSLASAVVRNYLQHFIQDNCVWHALEYFKDVETPRLQFTECAWSIARLDDLLARRDFSVPVDEICAVKVDVEGFEEQALKGGVRTLSLHRPLVFIEGANRNPGVTGFLNELGYLFADLDGNGCALSDRVSLRANGFFLHHTRLDDYRRLGLLRG
jgi:FkbM family methyltransferase